MSEQYEITNEFTSSMIEAGIEPPAEIIADGQLHRFHVEGDKSRSENGWYVLYPDAPAAGSFGDWKRGIVEKWVTGRKETTTPEERAILMARNEELRRVRQADWEQKTAETRARAQEILSAAKPAKDHPYLSKKGISPVRGIFISANGSLIVPVRDAEKVLHGLQFIDTEGGKKFLSGTVKAAHYFAIGTTCEIMCICEGLATGISVHEATELSVAIAFDAGNLRSVAESLRKKFPRATIVICGDSDPNGIGQTKAQEASDAVGGIAVTPKFESLQGSPTDFNDLHTREGKKAVSEQIFKEISNPAINERRAASTKKSGDWLPPGVIEEALLPVPEFDAEILLPDSLREYVEDEADRMPCPPVFVAVSLLVALGSLIGCRCVILPKINDTWTVIANLWGAIVGPPSAKKSPAIGAGLKPLNAMASRQRKKFSAEMEEYEMKMLIQGAKEEALQSKIKAAAKDNTKGDADALAQELLSERRNAPPPPSLRRYTTNDSTVEMLGQLLQNNPLGLMVNRDELTGLLAAMEKAGHEGDRAFYLEAWNGVNAYETDRIGRGSIHIPNLCLALFGGIQPDKLLAYLELVAHDLGNDGLLQRFQLLVYPDNHPWEWRDRVPNKAAYGKVLEIFEKLDDLEPITWGASPADERIRFPHFRFDTEAEGIYRCWAEELHTEKLPQESQPILAQHLAKFDKLFPALALIFHLVDCATTGPAAEVSAESAIRAAAWCEFLEAHARRCYGLLADDGLRAAQTLAKHIQKQKLKDGFTVRDVRRNQWRHLTTTEAILSAIEWLEDENHIQPETVSAGHQGGRPTTIYRINPALLLAKEGDDHVDEMG